MNKGIKYSQGPMGKVRAVDDFLPPPENLIFKEDTTKVTLRLSNRSLAFFKEKARESHASYQRMIRNLLDLYVMRLKQK